MSFRILHWGLAARRFLEAKESVKNKEYLRLGLELGLPGIDLASIYKRNLVGKLDGYPETVKEMCKYWDQVGLINISNLTECTAYPMTEEEVIDAIKRINKRLDLFEESKKKEEFV